MPEAQTKQSSFLIKRPLLAGAIAATAVSALPAQAALVDVFLKITGPDINGEAIAKGHEKDITVLSFQSSFALVKPENVLRLGKPSCGPVEITKNLDTASGPLTDALMKSTTLSKAVFTFVKSGEEQQEFYTVTLTSAYVTAITQASEGNVPGETVDFLARGIELSYKPQDAKTGALGQAVVTTIDCAAAAK
jgi:type VI secretion system Hcp family effector